MSHVLTSRMSSISVELRESPFGRSVGHETKWKNVNYQHKTRLKSYFIHNKEIPFRCTIEIKKIIWTFNQSKQNKLLFCKTLRNIPVKHMRTNFLHHFVINDRESIQIFQENKICVQEIFALQQSVANLHEIQGLCFCCPL